MKKRFKLLAAILACAMLPACGQPSAPSSSQPQSQPKSDSSSSEASSSNAESESQPVDTADTGDRPKLNILIPYAPFDVKTDNAGKELSKHTGYEIEFDTLPEQNSNDRLNLIFSSGNIDYDYIRIGSGDVERSLFATYASRGLLEDLTEKIPNYDKLSQIDARGFEALTQNGSVYGIPSTGLPYASSTNAIRMDWLDKVKKDVPTTPDELYDVLKAFKEQDPDSLGENNIPYTALPQTVDGAISAGFGILFNYEERDGKIVDARMLPEYKEYLAFMNKLYSEGLLDADMPVNTGTKHLEKCASGRVGFYTGGTDQARDLLISKRQNGQDGTYYQIIPPFQDSTGKQRAASLEGLFGIGMIPKGSETADHVLNFMNVYLSDDVFESIIHGQENVDYKIENSERIPILPDFDQNRGNMYALFPVQNGETYVDLWKLRTKKTPEAGMFFQQVFDEAGDYLEVNPIGFAPSFDGISDKVKVVQEYALQEATKFIAGARSLDEFDAFVEEMKAKGADEIVEAYNQWYKAK